LAAEALFTEDATYRETPFEEVMTGRGAIRAYWQAEVADRQDEISFGSDILSLEGDRAFVRWWVSYLRTRDGERFRLDGIFALDFEPATGLCRSLREWWHADPSVLSRLVYSVDPDRPFRLERA
jgi:hypothetical protein